MARIVRNIEDARRLFVQVRNCEVPQYVTQLADLAAMHKAASILWADGNGESDANAAELLWHMVDTLS